MITDVEGLNNLSKPSDIIYNKASLLTSRTTDQVCSLLNYRATTLKLATRTPLPRHGGNVQE